ncbi:MAG: hypothetical protein JXQ23_06055 [Clostridia bacterium]|nr:hypothetical protein [Clostridia bacterium]
MKKKNYAYVTFMMKNDSFLPGALVIAYRLRKMNTSNDLVCMVTNKISNSAIGALKLVYDKVIVTEELFVSHQMSGKRQDRPYLFTRFQALRLGLDGDLGQKYEKIVLMDADIMPLIHYDDLFQLETPAGILNERKENCIGQHNHQEKEKWIWHDIYESVCSHGNIIPKYITDRVSTDCSNMGVNACLWVLKPDFEDYIGIMKCLLEMSVRHEISRYQWPEMQVATIYWSGKWHNIDLRYCSFNGHPNLSCLYGTHFAGIKPWSEHDIDSVSHYYKYDDYKMWFAEFAEMMYYYPNLKKITKLDNLLQNYYHIIIKRDRA